jgi:predicted MFS family arabinose efflux permease
MSSSTQHGPVTPPTAREKAAVFLTGFSAFLTLYAPQPVLPDMARSLQVTAAVAGSVIGATTLAVAAVAPLAGPLVDRFGRKRMVLAGLLALVPLNLLLAFCSTLTQVLAVRFLEGAVLPAVFAGATALIATRWHGIAAAAMGLYVSGSAMGGFAGRLIAGLSVDSLGWQGGFLVLALVSLPCLPLIQRWLPDDGAHHQDGAVGGHLEAILRLVRDPRLLAACLFGAVALFSMTGTLSYIGFRLAGPPFSLSAAMIGGVFLIYPVGAAVVPFNGRLLRWFGPRGGLLAALAICATGVAALMVPHLAVTTLGIAVFISGVFLCQSLALSFVGRIAGRNKGAAAGLYVSSFYLGGSLGSVVCGLAWQSWGWTGCAVVVLTALAIGAGAALGMREERLARPVAGLAQA